MFQHYKQLPRFNLIKVSFDRSLDNVKASITETSALALECLGACGIEICGVFPPGHIPVVASIKVKSISHAAHYFSKKCCHAIIYSEQVELLVMK